MTASEQRSRTLGVIGSALTTIAMLMAVVLQLADGQSIGEAPVMIPLIIGSAALVIAVVQIIQYGRFKRS
ncbi:hypothetical protein [Streptomyces sp. HB132]|uniref:hypothetical protein n=1 Tax=Streptomyces sp. HB132 TaxID=767388 RepID=UPI0019614CEB|nr:hypothetical protein [Streptomyces sp. HB132]MBM7439289.1 hypothetical protein [Streptomyces sp. HB132]